MARRKPVPAEPADAGFDLGFGLPRAASREEAADLVNERIEQGLIQADQTWEDLAGSIRGQLARGQASAESTLASLSSVVRDPLVSGQATARSALSDLRGSIEGQLAEATGRAFSEARPLGPAAPSFEAAVAAATGVSVPPVAPAVSQAVMPILPAPNGSRGPSPTAGEPCPPPGWQWSVNVPLPACLLATGITPENWDQWPRESIVPLPGYSRVGGIWMRPRLEDVLLGQLPPPPTAEEFVPVTEAELLTYTPSSSIIDDGNGGGGGGGIGGCNDPPPPLPECPVGKMAIAVPGFSATWQDIPADAWKVCPYAYGYTFMRYVCVDDPNYCPGCDEEPPPPPPPPPPPEECPECPECPPPPPPPEEEEEEEIEDETIEKACKDLPDAPTSGIPRFDRAVTWFLGLTDSEGQAKTPPWAASLNWGWFTLGTGLAAAGRLIIQQGLEPISRLLSGLTCGGPNQAKLQSQMAVYGFIGQWLGIRPLPIIRPVEQNSAYLCPTEMPSAAAANATWLADAIDEEEWKCWTRADNVRDDLWEKVRHGARQKLSPLEIVMLWRRDRMTDAEFQTRIRELGYTDDQIPNELIDVTRFVPPISDLIRMMVRDVDDQNLVQKFGLDDEFNAKWGAQLQEWGKWQGIEPDVARRYWRAHWDIPSPTQLYEMLHRLSRLPAGDPRRTTLQDVEDALKQDDKLPFWIPRLLAISHHPINPGDAYKARQVGQLQFGDVVEILEQQGYTHSDADTIARSWDALIERSAERYPLSRLYIQGGASQTQVEHDLSSRGMDNTRIAYVIGRLNSRRKATFRRQCLRYWKKRYFLGEWTDPQAVQFLSGQNLDVQDVNDIMSLWQCERSARGKSISAGSLCSMLDLGVINAPEMYSRLLNLGFTSEDATLLVQQCSARIAKKQNAAEAREMARRERQAKEQARTIERQQSKSEAEERRRQRAILKCQQAQEARDRNILTAASVMAAKLDEEIYDAQQRVKEVIETLALNTPNGRIPLAQAAVTVARSGSVSDWTEFAEGLSAFASENATADLACQPTG